MAEPVQLIIAPHGHTWMLERDGHRVADYSHVEQAVHEAVRLARALEETGEPATVKVHAAEGKIIDIDVGPEVTQQEERLGPDPD